MAVIGHPQRLSALLTLLAFVESRFSHASLRDAGFGEPCSFSCSDDLLLLSLFLLLFPSGYTPCQGLFAIQHFNSVAKAACVSKAYLYSQPDLRERIEALRQQGVEQMVRERATHSPGKTDASRNLVILAKDRRIKELEAENRKLQQQLKGALGKAYDQL